MVSLGCYKIFFVTMQNCYNLKVTSIYIYTFNQNQNFIKKTPVIIFK